MKYAFANRHLIYALKTIIGRLYFFTRISGAMAPEWQTKNDFRAKVPRIRILFAKWVALANKIRQYYEDIENCSYFIRHSVAMALLMRTKNEQKNEGVPKVDMFRIPFVKWSPRHLYGDQKTLKKLIVRKSFVFCSPGNILSCHLVEGREPEYFWINNEANKKRLWGKGASHSYFVRQMGRPGEQNTTVLRRYRILFVFHSRFSRHGALNAHKKRTKNGRCAEGGYVTDFIRKMVAQALVWRTKKAQ